MEAFGAGLGALILGLAIFVLLILAILMPVFVYLMFQDIRSIKQALIEE